MKPKVPVLRGRIRVIFSFLFTYYFFISTQTIAQKILDPSFAEAIRNVCPTCIDASNNLLPPAAALTSLDVSYEGIQNLIGVSGFSSLKKLRCVGNQLTSLPTLPTELTTVLCDLNQITELTALPTGLTTLSCNSNRISSLANLPSGLINLSCNSNQIAFLTDLPTGLRVLSCDNNQLRSLTQLPKELTSLSCNNNLIASVLTLPGKIRKVSCSSNQLFRIWELPQSLDTLQCFKNQFNCLPKLPDSLLVLQLDSDRVTCLPNSVPGLKVFNANGTLLNDFSICVFIKNQALANAIRSNCPYCIGDCDNLTPYASLLSSLDVSFRLLPNLDGIEGFKGLQTLNCNGNFLTSLPNLPSTLINLNCSENQLTSLPSLPNNLKDLNCSRNQLSTLPVLPSRLITFSCSYNPITCLPLLPNSLRSLIIKGNGNIKCVPNFVPNLYIDGNFTGKLPLCGVPDAGFANAVKIACPTCMDDCYAFLPAAADITSLDVSDKNIKDLTGISVFTSLKTLNCSKNELVCLPTLPKSITSLTIDADKITCLPNELPDLKVYNADGVQIPIPPVCTQVIPDVNFANAIRSVCPDCIDICNNLLPKAATLEYLSISNSQIVSLDGIAGFKNLKTLSCFGNQLTKLPTLPSSLLSLGCSSNYLTGLPDLPVTLIELNCSYNQITSLPHLPNALTHLDCSVNKLTSLPGLPESLVNLYCGHNSLHCLPLLPKTLRYLNLSEVDTIKCLPNLVKELKINGISSESFPICSITDANFSQAIQSACPSCIDECAKIQSPAASLVSLDVSDKNIVNLSGIEAFTSLQSLNCSKNQLTCLPKLPQTLKSLTIDPDKITCLPNEILGLKVYNAEGNPIPTPPICSQFIPDINFANAIRKSCPPCIDVCNNLTPIAAIVESLNIPNSNISDLSGIEGFKNLKNLYCNDNQLTGLSKLPTGLVNLFCYNNKLTNITDLPGTLSFLLCDYNKLTQLPDLPATLNTLRCTNNNLTALPFLPNSLTEIRCGENQLMALPNLPNSITSLACQNNKLINLPNLPNKLTSLNCRGNRLSSLPDLPISLIGLNCDNNLLTYLPPLPINLTSITCHNNQIICVPNIPFALQNISIDTDKVFCIPNLDPQQNVFDQFGRQIPSSNLSCSGTQSLSEVTASISNPISIGESVRFTINRNNTGSVNVKWQRRKSNETDFVDISPYTVSFGISNTITYTVSNLSAADDGSSYRAIINSPCYTTLISNSITIRVEKEGLTAPIIISNQKDTVCVGQKVKLSTTCPNGTSVEWSTGATGTVIEVASVMTSSRSYTAKCILGDNKTASSPIKVIFWKPFEVTIINVGQSQSGVKPGINVPMSAWSGQFIIPDLGPELKNSTQANPTIYYTENTNKTFPRYWTAHVDICDLPDSGSITYDMLTRPEVGINMSFNTHENSAPYLMYANRDGFTELYAQNNVFFGFYEKDNNGQNRYDAGLPKGLYKLSIRYWNQKGAGLAPAVRVPQGSQLSYQEHWFRIQSQAGVGSGAAREGTAEMSEDVFVTIAPNPASKYVVLRLQNAKQQEVHYELVDVSGRIRFQGKVITETNTHAEYIDISHQATGMYLIRVNSSTKQTVLKVIKTE